MTTVVETLKKALEGILAYTETKKPKTMAEAQHMLAVVNVIAGESLKEDEPGHAG